MTLQVLTAILSPRAGRREPCDAYHSPCEPWLSTRAEGAAICHSYLRGNCAVRNTVNPVFIRNVCNSAGWMDSRVTQRAAMGCHLRTPTYATHSIRAHAS